MTGINNSSGARDAIIERYRSHLSSGLAFIAQTSGMPVEAESEGPYVWDSEGRRYLDCGGYGVFLHGHRHPKVVAAVDAQLHRHPLISHSGLNPQLASAAEILLATTPPYLERVRFTNSGAEAVDLALKIARLHGKRRIIATTNGYHGKTLGALSVTGKPVFRDPFLPLLPDVTFIPFNDVQAFKAEVRHAPEETCVIVEPIQAEGGVRVPDEGYLAAMSAVCRDCGAMFIIDDIQAGMGRTGPMWNADATEVQPHLLLAGKSLGGGVMPVAAVISDEASFDPLFRDPFLHSSTFAGNPLAMAAVGAAITAYQDEDFAASVARIGPQLLDAFGSRKTPHLLEVRGRGLLIGMEFRQPDIAIDFLLALRSHGVLASHSLNDSAVVRVLPPAILDSQHVAALIESVEASLFDLNAGR